MRSVGVNMIIDKVKRVSMEASITKKIFRLKEVYPVPYVLNFSSPFCQKYFYRSKSVLRIADFVFD